MSFGMTNILAIGAVVIIGTITTKHSGEKVKDKAQQSITTPHDMINLVKVAEILSK